MENLGKNIRINQVLNNSKLTNGEIWIGSLSLNLATQIKDEYSKIFVDCFIDYDQLCDVAENNRMKPSEYLIEAVLPDEQGIGTKQGDFGEIFSQLFLESWQDSPEFPFLKWRTKNHNNASTQGQDILGYYFEKVSGNDWHENDKIVLCEVKTNASKNHVNHSIIQEVYSDLKNNHVSKINKYILTIQRHLMNNSPSEQARQKAQNFARFTKPYQMPFKRRLIGAVVIERDNWDSEFLENLPQKHNLDPDLVEILVLQIEELSFWIDEVYRSSAQWVDS
ncbi:MAG: Hachiman antiphage defense system protein HamA [bacterium]